MEKRACLECGELINGRTDKKFCSDLCRNSYNNKQNSESTNYIRNINNILRKNRRILEDHLDGEKTTISRKKLVDKGFNFSYYTNLVTTKNNHRYTFCYEFGYLPIEDKDLVLIVKRKAE